jgi:DNA-binding CsgD family transcriptional regulator
MRAEPLAWTVGRMSTPVTPVFEPGETFRSHRIGRDVDRAFWAALEQSATAPEPGRRDSGGDEPVTSIAYVAIGLTKVWQGQIEEAEAWLDLAERALVSEVQPVAGMLLPDGMLLPFLLHYSAGLLQRQRPSRTAPAILISQILNLLDVEARPASRPSRPQDPDDPLTDSEIRVLRYLPTRLTAREIARQLCLSVHTVTTHTRHIYAKLGVHRRHEAVERARARGLLAPIPGLTSVHST